MSSSGLSLRLSLTLLARFRLSPPSLSFAALSVWSGSLLCASAVSSCCESSLDDDAACCARSGIGSTHDGVLYSMPATPGVVKDVSRDE